MIAVLADDPAAYSDIPAWCGLKSHDCVFRGRLRDRLVVRRPPPLLTLSAGRAEDRNSGGALNVLVIYVIPIAGVVLAVAGTWYARTSVGPAVRQERRERRRESFRAVRRWMRALGSERQIVQAAHRAHADLLAPAPMNLFIAEPAHGLFPSRWTWTG